MGIEYHARSYRGNPSLTLVQANQNVEKYSARLDVEGFEGLLAALEALAR
jgi:hypothetical protein